MYEAAFEFIAKEVPQFKPDFHNNGSIWRHIQSIGLQSRYINDPDFSLNIRKLLAFAFVPAEDIVKQFNELIESKFWSDNEEDEDDAKIQLLTQITPLKHGTAY